MKRILSLILTLSLLTCLAACGSVGGKSQDTQGSNAEAPASSSDTGITGMRFAVDKSPLSIEAGNTEKGYFKVEGNDDFSLDDIEFVSSDPSVVTFEYDKTALTTCVYYTINGLKAGSATVYAQTKDGTVKTSEISVTVAGYLYSVADFDDTSIPTAKRMTLRVTASEDYIYSMTDSEIEAMLKYIADNYASTHSMNAVIVYLFCDGDDTSGAYTIGACTYAPEGDISKASDVEAGDYSTFDYDITIYSEAERALYRQ